MRKNGRDCKQNFKEIDRSKNSFVWKIEIPPLHVYFHSTRRLSQSKIQSQGKDHIEGITVIFFINVIGKVQVIYPLKQKDFKET